ncbi:unnamed protein product, partial [Eruca vesicaria subsp. sativa]|nr:unnamed protein product [Eruca vesicaria subsp. sativa]
VAWFECIATVDDVVHGSPWYYIGCGVFHTKAIKGPTTLMYLTKLSVYDNNDHASFVLLGDAGLVLIGKQASELVESYVEIITDLSIILSRKFILKVSNYNLTGKTQSLTVTKVLTPKAQASEGDLGENVVAPAAEETLHMGKHEDGPSIGHKEYGDESVKRSSEMAEIAERKRPRCG